MKDQTLSNFEKSITKRLFNPWVSNYWKFTKEIIFALNQNTEIIEKDKSVIIDTINHWVQKFPKNPTHPEVIEFINQEFRRTSNIESNITVDYIVKDINEKDWIEIQNDLNIQQPLDWVLYRWWIARNILRKILWIEKNNFDSELNDVDAFILPNLDKKQVTEFYNTWSDWISYIESLEPDIIQEKLSQVDCNINQVFISKYKIYYTNECEDGIKNNYITPIGKWKNIYNILSYQQWDNIIYSSNLIMRAIKFLCEQKVNSLLIKPYNIESYNFTQLKPDNDILALVRKFIYKNNANLLLCNLNDILKQINFLWEWREYIDIVDYIEQQIIQKPYFSFANRSPDLQREANRLLTKIIKQYKHNIINETENIWWPDIIITKQQSNEQDRVITLSNNINWNFIHRLEKLIEDLRKR